MNREEYKANLKKSLGSRYVDGSSLEDAEAIYLEYFNNYLSLDRYAEDLGISPKKLNAIIDEGRVLNHKR